MDVRVSCRQLQRYHQYYAIISQVIVGRTFYTLHLIPCGRSNLSVILIIRTYALYNRSKRILMGLSALAVTLVSVSKL